MLKSMSSPYISIMENALSASSLRHQVISNNIANVNTPGFKKSQVTFEDELKEALESKNSILARTHERHYPFAGKTAISAKINNISETRMRVDGNNVDIDEEMAQMAKNNIYYNALVQKVQNYFSNLKTAVSGGK